MTKFTSLEALQDFFSNEHPRLVRYAEMHFAHLDVEKREEAVADTLGLAWKFLHRLFESGRATKRMVGSVLWYAVKQTKDGRLVQGREGRGAKCALDYRRRGRVKFEWTEMNGLIGRNTPVLDQVIFRVDVRRFLTSLNSRQQAFAFDLATGMTTTEVAKKYDVTQGAVSQFRKRFRKKYEQFFDE